MNKGQETQVGGNGEGQPYLATTCCTTNIILMKVDSKFLCFSVEEVTNCSFCLFNRQCNNNDTEH